MSTKIQSRRKLIVAVLLCVAVGGAIVRHYATPGSTTRDIGTLLMVLWVPIIGNVIAWLIGKLPRRAPKQAPPEGFDTRPEFTPHLRAELTFRRPSVPAQDVPLGPGEYRGALVLGTEGFSARWRVPQGESLARGTPVALDIEFLSPAVAQPKFAQGTAFRVLVDESFVADGQALQSRPART